jgi:hypothetical protein
MLRTISAFALVLTFAGTPAFAAMDCEHEFRVRVDKMMGKPDIRMPISDMVASTRFLVQGYDSCMKGEMDDAKSFFEKAFSMGHSGSGGSGK